MRQPFIVLVLLGLTWSVPGLAQNASQLIKTPSSSLNILSFPNNSGGSTTINLQPNTVTAYTASGVVSTGQFKVYYAAATTTATGTWSLSFPNGLTWSTAPSCHATPISGTTVITSYIATISTNSVTTVGGSVLVSNTIAVGGQGLAFAGAGITVNVECLGF